MIDMETIFEREDTLYSIQQFGTSQVHRNLTAAQLVELAIRRREGTIASSGALSVSTGAITGRSPKDKFIAMEPAVSEHIEWGNVNRPIEPRQVERLYRRALEYMQGKELFVFDGYAGADQHDRLSIRVINEFAWQNLFARQLLIRPEASELDRYRPEFTVIALPGLKADPAQDGTRSETFIVISFERRLVLIGGTHYAGEIKKSIFSVLNYLLPFRGTLPMHCSANVGDQGDVALFFGLSGTGKTTLSADASRRLIGDDEHGWSERGVYTFEGGCYAKCIGLSRDKEPQIWDAVRFGAVLENVTVNPETSVPNFDDHSMTENTRAAYPIDYIPGAVIPGTAGHPNVVLFLTADAFGVLPPISKLTKEQAMYYFLSGYTSKLAGTERGVTRPEATFSTCFGAPFLPLRPSVYAEMLGRNIDRHNTRVYLVNTGWTGGPYGVGERIKLRYTRSMIGAALTGSIEQASFVVDPFFRLAYPTELPGVPAELLNPKSTWSDPSAYDETALGLVARFEENFKRFEGICAPCL